MNGTYVSGYGDIKPAVAETFGPGIAAAVADIETRHAVAVEMSGAWSYWLAVERAAVDHAIEILRDLQGS